MLSSSLRVAVATLVVAAAVLPAGAAHATVPGAVSGAGGTGSTGAPAAGSARAVTAEVDLDVSLLNNAVDVPVNISLNKVESPARRDGSVLTAKVDGVDQQGPVTLVKADVGRSVTTVDAKGTAASVELVNADVHAPGLPLTALLGLEALSSKVTCPVDGPPTADVTAPAKLTVLGKPVAVGLYAPTKVDVPAVGSVSVEFSRRSTTSSTAAASALEVRIELNPLNLNVAKVSGTVTIASVSCEKPAAGSTTPTTAATTATAPTTPAAVKAADSTGSGRAAVPQAGTGEHLAATGSSGTGPLAAGAAALIAGGAGALWFARRRRAHARRH
ncbi:LPXTG cell wall anchor domain-containing protein [Kitasatospora sp. NBC_00240]|uniref:SCO1860 family LAETG-anchored protein n=1 Tax=Kitasatospora sp. NBC_00240 TaxID=2903567 RepID=UPI0022557C59|nr:SCO1860 family LAETG-anchored protein [Kitasatospora sp. NBC_00240]MCX5210242.1 LPXTG cell wall anchor domain-containing protein [Kitasatospora sp. NBC_00240]